MQTTLTLTRPDGSKMKYKPDRTNMKIFVRNCCWDIIAFYEDPENMRRFEEWKTERDKKAMSAKV